MRASLILLFIFLAPLNDSYAEIEMSESFPSKSVTIHCDPADYDLLLMSVSAKKANVQYDYIFRRAWPIGTCQMRSREIKKILSQSANVRITGLANEWELEELRTAIERTFVFKSIEGNVGCHGYFEHDCRK